MTGTKRNIRFGVICGKYVSAWQKITIEKLISEADIELKLLIRAIRPEKNCSSMFYNSTSVANLWWKWYYKYLVGARAKSLKKKETDLVFANVPGISCSFIETDLNVELQDTDCAKIEKSCLDFILDFSNLSLTGKILKTAQLGVWTYRFGNLEKYMDPPCFWEIYNKEVITKATLVRLTNETDSVMILKEGAFKTSISYPKNIDKIHLEVTSWPLQMCTDIKNNNTENFKTETTFKSNKTTTPPSVIQLVKLFLVQVQRYAKKVTKLLFYTDYWNIGVAFIPIHEFLKSQKPPQIKWFNDLPSDRFMADPFGIYFKNNLHIIYEDLHFRQGIGKTAKFLFKDDSFSENSIIIDEAFHMSYPFLLELEDEIYCIPETYQANEVRLYKALEFPNTWKFEKVLINNYAGIDNTLFEHNDIWYLFSTNKDSGPHYNLNIHYSDSIFGPWQEHPKNPVKTDIRSARPAGTIFEFNDAIFRPSMDYSEKIEGRIIINKIVTLTVTDFKEEMHTIVNPFENTNFCDKVHTLSQVGRYTLVDGAKELFIFSNINAFRYKISRILDRLLVLLCGFIVF